MTPVVVAAPTVLPRLRVCGDVLPRRCLRTSLETSLGRTYSTRSALFQKRGGWGGGCCSFVVGTWLWSFFTCWVYSGAVDKCEKVLACSGGDSLRSTAGSVA